MAFLQAHYWREQYLGQRKPIVVDSNCDEVTLKVNGKVVGTLKPSAANNHSVTFEGVAVERGTIAVEGRKGAQLAVYAVTMAGKPARVVLTPSAKTIVADRAGVALLYAAIADAARLPVLRALPTLT